MWDACIVLEEKVIADTDVLTDLEIIEMTIIMAATFYGICIVIASPQCGLKDPQTLIFTACVVSTHTEVG